MVDLKILIIGSGLILYNQKDDGKILPSPSSMRALNFTPRNTLDNLEQMVGGILGISLLTPFVFVFVLCSSVPRLTTAETSDPHRPVEVEGLEKARRF